MKIQSLKYNIVLCIVSWSIDYYWTQKILQKIMSNDPISLVLIQSDSIFLRKFTAVDPSFFTNEDVEVAWPVLDSLGAESMHIVGCK